jgi:2-C-methyl-D-erythritol 4-phosphate cytidylyltransferase
VPKFAVILPAAGKSSRFRDQHFKKPFAPLDNRAVWLHSAEKFLARDDVAQTILVIDPEDREEFRDRFGANVAILGVTVVDGGAHRAESVANGLSRVGSEVDFVAVHDAARPCLAEEWIDRVFAAAVRHDAAILATPVVGTLKRVTDDGTIRETVSRTGLWEAQTPQVFRRKLLLEAFAAGGDLQATDEAQLVEQFGHPVHIVPGSPINLKITTKDDLRLAGHLLKALPRPKNFGASHPFADDDMWR